MMKIYYLIHWKIILTKSKASNSIFQKNCKMHGILYCNDIYSFTFKFQINLQEKKLNVVTALRECCDAIYPILGIEAVQEDCLAALKHKTPQVKSETASFLARGFATCPQVLQTNKKVICRI